MYFAMLAQVKKYSFFLQLAVFLTGILLVKYFILDIRYVSGHSMEPVLSDGQCVFIWKLAYGIYLPYRGTYLIRWMHPQSGDIVCYAVQGRAVIKHCAKTGGALLDFLHHSEKTAGNYAVLRLNGNDIPLTAQQYHNLGGTLPKHLQTVPDQFILALGYNPSESYDSRDYGFVSVNSIYGKLLWQ